MHFQTTRKNRGNAPLSVMKVLALPVLMVAFLLIWEASYELYLRFQLTRIVTGISRAFSAEYQRSPGFVADLGSQKTYIDHYHSPLVFESDDQLKVKWQLGQLPLCLTVSATYLPGKGDPPMPPYAVFDPFHWFQAPIKASTTVPLM